MRSTEEFSKSDAALLEVNFVSKRFGGLEAVREVSFHVNKGEVHGLIGPNGAGKSTLFNLITGVLAVTKGSIKFKGHELTKLPPYKISQMGIARTFQNIRLFNSMTVLESIVVAQNVRAGYGLTSIIPFRSITETRFEKKMETLIRSFNLWEKRYERCSDLAYADQRSVEIARTLATEPELLLLDEPTAGMTEREVEECNERIKELVKQQGKTILLIEHNMNLAMRCCDRLTVLNFGQNIGEGAAEEVQANPAVVEAYLGSEEPLEASEVSSEEKVETKAG